MQLIGYVHYKVGQMPIKEEVNYHPYCIINPGTLVIASFNILKTKYQFRGGGNIKGVFPLLLISFISVTQYLPPLFNTITLNISYITNNITTILYKDILAPKRYIGSYRFCFGFSFFIF